MENRPTSSLNWRPRSKRKAIGLPPSSSIVSPRSPRAVVARPHFLPASADRSFGASKAYTDAQERFHTYLDSLKKAGRSDEASRLESAVRASITPTNTSEKLDELMQAGSQAF